MKTCPKCSKSCSDDMDFCPRDGTRLTTSEVGVDSQLLQSLGRRFKIVDCLGKGGMGQVYLAAQVDVGNRPVALKVLHRKLLDDPQFLMRFQSEAAAGRIKSRNVVMVYDSGQGEDGTPYIAMEYLEGQTLRRLLKARGALPLAECVEIVQQVARGLNAAHKRRIIHRDLKPDNIFLTLAEDVREGYAKLRQDPERFLYTVKLLDFGIAKLRESAFDTPSAFVLGTPSYMSYEQASGMKSEQLDARSDIYSLGVVVYEMLTGKVPFWSDTPLEIVRMHLTKEPPPFRSVNADLRPMPGVESVVMKALSKEREQRYGAALTFAEEFTEAATVAGNDQPAIVQIDSPPPTGLAERLQPFHLEYTLTSEQETVSSVAFSPDGEWLASGSYDNSVKMWNLGSKALVSTLEGHSERVLSVVISPNGKWLGSGSRDKTVKLWDAASGALRQTFRGHAHWVPSVAFCPHGKLLASAGWDKLIRLWDVNSLTLAETLLGHTEGVNSVAFSPDGRLLASGDLGGQLKVWDIASKTAVQTLKGPARGKVFSLAFSPNSTLLAAGFGVGTVILWYVASWKPARALAGKQSESVAFNPDGKVLACGGTFGGKILLWDVDSGARKQELSGHTGNIESVAFSPDGKLLASGSGDKTIKLWRAA